MIFSNIFEQVDSKALTLWKCKRYDITKQFYKRSSVSWPLGTIFEIFNLFANACRICKWQAPVFTIFEMHPFSLCIPV